MHALSQRNHDSNSMNEDLLGDGNDESKSDGTKSDNEEVDLIKNVVKPDLTLFRNYMLWSLSNETKVQFVQPAIVSSFGKGKTGFLQEAAAVVPEDEVLAEEEELPESPQK